MRMTDRVELEVGVAFLGNIRTQVTLARHQRWIRGRGPDWEKRVKKRANAKDSRKQWGKKPWYRCKQGH